MWSVKMVVIMIMLSQVSFAQRGPSSQPSVGVNDPFFIQTHVPTKKVIPYEFVREADVMWSKRVWRAIDLRQKFNFPLYYPLDEFQDDMDATDFGAWTRNTNCWSLWTIIRYHLLLGDLTLYSNFDPDWQKWQDGDLFKYPFLQSEKGDPAIQNGNFITDSVYREEIKSMQYLGYEIIDANPEPYAGADGYDSVDYVAGKLEVVYPPNEYKWYSSEDIIQYWIKEDWFFDKERSVMDVRIIGIAPVIYSKNELGNITGYKELFWLYFPECRYVFQNYFVHNRHNDSQRMSFDDLFWKRMFNSYIIKESNIHDREIKDYRSGVEALLESEKIKEDIFVFEHDLWSY